MKETQAVLMNVVRIASCAVLIFATVVASFASSFSTYQKERGLSIQAATLAPVVSVPKLEWQHWEKPTTSNSEFLHTHSFFACRIPTPARLFCLIERIAFYHITTIHAP